MSEKFTERFEVEMVRCVNPIWIWGAGQKNVKAGHNGAQLAMNQAGVMVQIPAMHTNPSAMFLIPFANIQQIDLKSG